MQMMKNMMIDHNTHKTTGIKSRELHFNSMISDHTGEIIPVLFWKADMFWDQLSVCGQY